MSPDDARWTGGLVRRWTGTCPRETYRAVLAERYAEPTWWPTPPPGTNDPGDAGARRLWDALAEVAEVDGRMGEVA